MQITVNLIDLLLALLILVGVVLGVVLVVFVFRLIQTLKHLSQLTTDLHDPLTQTAEKLPALIRRIDSISLDVEVLAKSAHESVPTILLDTKAITSTARAGVEIVGSAAENITSGVTSFFSPDRERPDNVSSIIGIISQVLNIVGLFTNSIKPKQPSTFSRRSKRRRH